MSQFLIKEELQSNGSNYVADESSFGSEDDDYSLKKKYYIKKNKNRGRRNKNGGTGGRHNQSLWNIQQNARYMHFLLEKGLLFNSNSIQRKAIKINVQMSESIKTRSPDQCRSHHQKMMKHHKDIPRIIQHIQKLLRNGLNPPSDKSIDSQSRTDISPSLKDLSNFQPSSDCEQSIWNQLLGSLSSEVCEADGKWIP